VFPLFSAAPEAPAFAGSTQEPSRALCRVWTESLACVRVPAWTAVPRAFPLPAGPPAIAVNAEVTRNAPARIAAPIFVFIFLTSFGC